MSAWSCSVASHGPTLSWVRSRFWVRVGLGSGLDSGKGRMVGTWHVNRFEQDFPDLPDLKQTLQASVTRTLDSVHAGSRLLGIDSV